MKTSTMAGICGALFGLGMFVAPAFADESDRRRESVEDQWRWYCNHDHDPKYNAYCERYMDRGDSDRNDDADRDNDDHDRWSEDQWRRFCSRHHDDRYNRRCERYSDDHEGWSDRQWREFCRHNDDDRYERQCERYED